MIDPATVNIEAARTGPILGYLYGFLAGIPWSWIVSALTALYLVLQIWLLVRKHKKMTRDNRREREAYAVADEGLDE